jgi:exodeoxyribonuclease-5
MEWTRQQEEALHMVGDWLRLKDSPFFYLAGWAGTGKTTLARHLMESVSGRVIGMAATAKAAYVLRQKGFAETMTIHKAIYQTKEKGKARLRELETLHAKLVAAVPRDHNAIEETKLLLEAERTALARPYFTLNPEGPAASATALVVDEGSMVDDQMAADILSFNKPVLVLADPAQLPPVYGAGFFTKRKPHYTLTDIRRQALDNPIIAMSKRVREGYALTLGNYGNSRVCRKEDIAPQEAVAAGQIIVGTNATRRAVNHRCRELLGRAGPGNMMDLPVQGDLLVCLRNNYELDILNGSQWRLVQDAFFDHDKVHLAAEDVDDQFHDVVCDAWAFHFMRGMPEVKPWIRKEAQEFDYGYGLTAHKAQGSQWNEVLVYDESYAFAQSRQEWLYTAITRAAEKVTVARM